MWNAKHGAAASLVLLCACTTGAREPPANEPGANSGIVVGSQVEADPQAPKVGALEGGLLGSPIGQSLNEEDQKIAAQAEYEALEYGRAGRPSEWRSATTDSRGHIVVGPSYEVNRLDCREYTHTVTIGGRARVARGTACRQPGGTWRMVG